MAQETFGLRKIQYAIIWLGCSLAACKAIPLYNPDSKLEIQWLNITDGDRDATRAASCADGSPAAYYYDEAENADEDMPFIIWIGDTSLCSSSDCDELCDVDGICEEDDDFENLAEEDQQESEARCYYSRAICTSKFYNEYQSLTPLTVLREDDEVFRDYRRVFLPSCSLDWFLGDGDNTDPESPRFRGFRILEEFFQDLIVNHNLLLAKTVILGGTRGGGVSVLNHLALIKSWLEPTQRILTIVDSAWYPFFEEFQAPVSEARFPDSISVLRERFQNNTQDFFATAKLLPPCQTRWSSGPNPQPINCLFASELLREYQDMPIFVVQSQYDLVHLLSDSDLLGESVDVVDDFIDETSVGAAAASYVESYGDVVRISLDQAGAQSFGGTNQHYFYTPSCAHHGYILPSSAHQVPTTVQQLGQAGGINFRRSSEHWTKIQIAGLNLQSALQQWVLSSGTRFPVAGGNGTDGIGNDTLRIWNNVRDDECTSFLCNESCLASVVPWRLGQALQECFSFMVFAYGILLIFLFYFMFMLAYFKILAFRSMCNTFWTEHKHELVPVLANQATLKRAHSAPKDIAIDPNQEAFLSEVASSEFRKMSLMVNDLEYAAPPRSRRDKPHVILKGVNLNFKPGEVHALMGPSGSGKSTLLDILALTRDSGTVAGKHYINGVETWSAKGAFLKEWLRHNLSYVGQSDVLFPQLTVKEHLTHAAWLLLPEFMDDQARLNRVLHVVKLLELETCIDTICGDGGVSVSGGISGGQRRRVSIATQLLRMPAALLLDEPTSGLDSTNALLLVKSLHLLAHRAGVNVVMTIHQPRKEIYGFLDHLSILVKGSVIFSGHPDSAASHFNVQRGGLSNVGNEILDILSKSSESSIQGFAQRYESGPLGDMTRKGMALEVTELSQEVALTLRTVLMENALGEGRWSWTESSSASTLMWVLMSRTIQRGGFDIQRTCAVSALGGLLVGFVFFNVNTPSSRAALSYLLVSSLTLIQSTFLGDRYLGEKAMFHHERGAGTVTAWTAFLSSQFIRNAVTSTLETFCFAVPVYFLGGMNLDELIRFPVFILVMSLVALAVISQNLWIQIDRNTVRGSALLQVVFLAIGALFNGFIIRLDDLPAALSWLPYILINYWGFVGTLINDLNGVSFSCDSVNNLECTARTGDAVIRSLSYDDRDVPMCILALVGIILVFHVMGILDFYIRYVHRRGSQLKQVAGHDGINYYKPKGGGSNYNFSTPDSSPSMTASASPGGMGKTMDGMIAAADAQKSPESKAGGDRSPPGSPLALGSPGKRNAPVKNKKGGEIHFVDDDDDSSFGFNMNSNVGGLPDDDSSNPVIRTFPFKGKYLVSRQTLAMLFLVDFIATGYICADNGDPLANTMVTLTTVIFSLLYVTQFVYQIAFLVPASPDGAVDCTWGGMYDGVGVPCTIADIGLSIQLVSNLNPDMENNQFVVLFALQMVVRLCRFARVWTFWNKVTAYHRVRAEVFLQDRFEMNKAEAQGGGAGEVKKLPPPILPPRRPRISIRRAKPPAPGMQEQRFANQSQQKAPPRPPRPNGLGQLFGQTAPPPRPVRSRDTLHLGQQWQSYHHSSGSSHKKVTYSAHQQELLARLQQQQRQQLRYSQQQQQHGGGRARGNTGASGRARGNTGPSGKSRGNTGASGRTRGNTDASGTRRRQQPNQRGGITLDEV